MVRDMSAAFTGGAVGALANVAFISILSTYGVAGWLGVSLPEPPMPGFLYKQVAWGGLWGLALALPILTRSWVLRGLVLGALASLAALVYFFPAQSGAFGGGPGMWGLNFGAMMPVVVLAANSVWGLTAAAWYRYAR